MKTLISIIFLIFYLSAHTQQDTIGINKKMLTTAIVTEAVIYTGLISGLRYAWYKDVPRVPFHYYNDNKGYLQIDKFGHAYGAYAESMICYEWLRKAGVSKTKSLIYGGSMGLILQTPIEIFDGLYQGWGFSWGDMLANAAGSAFMVGQEWIFDEQIIVFKFSFSRSDLAERANGMLGDHPLESLLYDYNGHTYWMSINPFRNSSFIPKWFNLSLGYSANGMLGEFENRLTWKGRDLPEVERYRQVLVSLDIDWTAIETNRPFLRKLFYAMNHIKLPFPALEYNSLGKWRFHYLYF
ncbi:DUF2279 domain-containing protein [Portibacter marinus]|uniref:DUF2279 domain-containing protein n=1 Tax=Portibacter marinus TaxID=2898660 RepID=UPI001F47263D|nr:DUF2279 domain-containing protein [Portibacter marinus]